ncbi:MAG TPA: 3',5'-cyclic-AMP phosphodiesterase [Rhodobacteraceae bacterium]|nr:3',5'-cyclic-AMP phosphodiesterase [Paracoccaceae bacterium]
MQPDTPFEDLPPGALRLLQITDPHIFGNPEKNLLGVDTRASLAQVIDRVSTSVSGLDAVLLTGDIVHDNSDAGYLVARELLSRLHAPVYVLPGNHDERSRLPLLQSGNSRTDKRIELGDWRILMLDSTRAGDESGELADKELRILEHALNERPERHALVCLHHHPVPVGSAWLDKIGLRNSDAFFELLDRHANVRCVLWGHIHQAFDQRRNGVRLLGTPSTCIQFMPGKTDFEVDAQPPGYRWLALLPDGGIRTRIGRVEHVSGGLELDSEGY